MVRCKEAELEATYPLWQGNRRSLVEELINLGYRAKITVVNTKLLPSAFLGKELTLELLDEIEATGADACGENGEYHTFVFDGPLFQKAIPFQMSLPQMEQPYTYITIEEKIG